VRRLLAFAIYEPPDTLEHLFYILERKHLLVRRLVLA
jgi:hypothetical protein